MVLKANYSKIASVYDKGRPLHEKNSNLWLGLISKYSKAGAGSKVLDLGCGTGRFAIPMADKLKYHVTGADASKEMLAKAKEKDIDGLVKWDVQDAENLTYPNCSFDVVFTSHLVYHVKFPSKVIKNCERILNKPGAVIVRYATIDQIRDDVVHKFFPEVIAIDKERFPTLEMVENWLKDSGFKDIVSENILQKSYETGTEHLNAISVKNVSGLTMISQKAFEKGMRNLEKFAEKNTNDPLLLFDRLTITVGNK